MTVTTQFSREQVIEAARALVDELGRDRVNQYPVYVRNGEPDCLIGRIVARLGQPLPPEDNAVSKSLNRSRFSRLPAQFLEGFEPEAIRFLQLLQDGADLQWKWGGVLDYALSMQAESRLG